MKTDSSSKVRSRNFMISVLLIFSLVSIIKSSVPGVHDYFGFENRVYRYPEFKFFGIEWNESTSKRQSICEKSFMKIEIILWDADMSTIVKNKPIYIFDKNTMKIEIMRKRILKNPSKGSEIDQIFKKVDLIKKDDLIEVHESKKYSHLQLYVKFEEEERVTKFIEDAQHEQELTVLIGLKDELCKKHYTLVYCIDLKESSSPLTRFGVGDSKINKHGNYHFEFKKDNYVRFFRTLPYKLDDLKKYTSEDIRDILRGVKQVDPTEGMHTVTNPRVKNKYELQDRKISPEKSGEFEQEVKQQQVKQKFIQPVEEEEIIEEKSTDGKEEGDKKKKNSSYWKSPGGKNLIVLSALCAVGFFAPMIIFVGPIITTL